MKIPFRRNHEPAVDLSSFVTYDPETSYLRDFPTTTRTFAFVDVTEFTNYTHKYGIHAAAQMLTKFRQAVRIVVGQHRVRVAKWLGDGVMLVGVSSRPICAAVYELNELFRGDDFFIHSGIARGSVIIFEGDDYVGRAVNVAARLCQHARPSEILVYDLTGRHIPADLRLYKLSEPLLLHGIGELDDIAALGPR